MKRRIEFEVETEKIVLRGPGPTTSWCRECAKPSLWISAEQAGLVAGVSEMQIYRMIDGDRLHHTETPEGRLTICVASVGPILPEAGSSDNDVRHNDRLIEGKETL